MIASLGVLLLVSLMVKAIMDVINARSLIHFRDTAVYMFHIFDVITLFATTTVLFVVILIEKFHRKML